ncbi:MAG: thymidylate synthase [archaeon]
MAEKTGEEVYSFEQKNLPDTLKIKYTSDEGTRNYDFSPIIHVSGESMPETMEKACLHLARKGLVYRRSDEKDNAWQVEAKMIMEIRNPDADPYTHLRFAGSNGLGQGLLDYLYEFMGAKRFWKPDADDPKDTRWEYTYFGSLSEYAGSKGPIDQIEAVKQKLIERPNTRRAQAITWHPERDLENQHTPCLQRIRFLVTPGDKRARLDMQYDFRTRNVMTAAFGNIMGLYILGCDVRDAVEQGTGIELDMRMIDSTDTFHVNSREFPVFMNSVRQVVNKKKSGQPLSKRTWKRSLVIDDLLSHRDYTEKFLVDKTTKMAEEYEGRKQRKVEQIRQIPQENMIRRNELLKELDAIPQINVEKETERTHKIGDRIFYLLDKYSPEKR